MQIPIDTAPLKALDVPTRWLLAEALDDGAKWAQLQIELDHASADDEEIAELERKTDAYRQIAEAIRD